MYVEKVNSTREKWERKQKCRVYIFIKYINRHYNPQTGWQGVKTIPKPKYHRFKSHNSLKSSNLKSGPYHSDGCGGAVKLPVEGQPGQLALQLHADVTVLLSRQRNLGPVVGSPVTSWQTGLNHLTQVGEESFDRGSQTSVQLLGGETRFIYQKKVSLIS